jgi:hypothetical protein
VDDFLKEKRFFGPPQLRKLIAEVNALHNGMIQFILNSTSDLVPEEPKNTISAERFMLRHLAFFRSKQEHSFWGNWQIAKDCLQNTFSKHALTRVLLEIAWVPCLNGRPLESLQLVPLPFHALHKWDKRTQREAILIKFTCALLQGEKVQAKGLMTQLYQKSSQSRDLVDHRRRELSFQIEFEEFDAAERTLQSQSHEAGVSLFSEMLIIRHELELNLATFRHNAAAQSYETFINISSHGGISPDLGNVALDVCTLFIRSGCPDWLIEFMADELQKATRVGNVFREARIHHAYALFYIHKRSFAEAWNHNQKTMQLTKEYGIARLYGNSLLLTWVIQCHLQIPAREVLQNLVTFSEKHSFRHSYSIASYLLFLEEEGMNPSSEQWVQFCATPGFNAGVSYFLGLAQRSASKVWFEVNAPGGTLFRLSEPSFRETILATPCILWNPGDGGLLHTAPLTLNKMGSKVTTRLQSGLSNLLELFFKKSRLSTTEIHASRSNGEYVPHRHHSAMQSLIRRLRLILMSFELEIVFNSSESVYQLQGKIPIYRLASISRHPYRGKTGERYHLFEETVKREIKERGVIETGALALTLKTNRQRLLPYLKKLESEGFIVKVRRGKRTLLLKT